jgi:glycosyltransferase involved in cell wall biosynthesis
VAISQAVADDATRHLLDKLPIQVVRNGIDTDRFYPGWTPGAWLDELSSLPPAPKRTVRVGLVATYARWKGHDVFLDAATRLVRQRPEDHFPLVRFYIIGGPIYQTVGSQWHRDELRHLAREVGRGSGGENRVGFIDFQADTAPVYRALDVVVHASTRPEPFGLTIAEAMACGRAVVVARAGGAAVLFTHGHDALGVRPGDPEDLAYALADLIANEPRRAQLGANARETARTKFTRARLGPEVLAVYRRFATTTTVRAETTAPALT